VLCIAASAIAADATQAESFNLQIINGSSQSIDIFWLKSDTERVPNGSVAPGNDTLIPSELGRRFAVVSHDGKTTATVTCEVPVQAYRFDPPSKDGVPSFYTQAVSANGFPIVASAAVNPYALKEAAYLVNMMLAKRADVRAAMVKSGARMCIMAYNQYTTDLPEFARLAEEKVDEFPRLPPKEYWDARARGLGGSDTDSYCSVAEENLLGYPGDPYEKECILIHEFAHNIHLRGLLNVDPTFDTRLKAAYEAAMKAGLWKGKYASVNHCEYFAEGVQSWFDNNRVNDHDHNYIHLRSQLIEYDPGLAAMCREVFGDTELKYTKPAKRLTGHLVGYDPAKAPTFAWPERLKHAKDEIHAQAEKRNMSANDDRETRIIAGWSVHISRDLLANEAKVTALSLELLQVQLEEIIRVVPAPAVAELQKVSLWFSSEYPGEPPTAEYHPDADWLLEQGRDPLMARGVEITDIRNFEAETRRMPNFILHELAHSYHDRVLPMGFDNPEIQVAYEKAKASGTYNRVEFRDSDGTKSMERAYAMTDPQEYFAESTEAFFSRNDFYPFNRAELKQHDPQMEKLLARLWGVIK
jgi:hypothetical protein